MEYPLNRVTLANPHSATVVARYHRILAFHWYQRAWSWRLLFSCALLPSMSSFFSSWARWSPRFAVQASLGFSGFLAPLSSALAKRFALAPLWIAFPLVWSYATSLLILWKFCQLLPFLHVQNLIKIFQRSSTTSMISQATSWRLRLVSNSVNQSCPSCSESFDFCFRMMAFFPISACFETHRSCRLQCLWNAC